MATTELIINVQIKFIGNQFQFVKINFDSIDILSSLKPVSYNSNTPPTNYTFEFLGGNKISSIEIVLQYIFKTPHALKTQISSDRLTKL